MADAFPQQRKSKKQHRKKRKCNPYKKGGPLRTQKTRKKKSGKSK
jgi:hypothetical protein